jgi:hypothetical protein
VIGLQPLELVQEAIELLVGDFGAVSLVVELFVTPDEGAKVLETLNGVHAVGSAQCISAPAADGLDLW